MRFPRTYIDQANIRLSTSQGMISNLKGVSVFKTGTTVVGLLNKDKTAGVIVSDGRATNENYIMDERFRKIFDCRIGYVGIAGVAGIGQKLVADFRSSLDNICDSRGVIMTAAGAARYLQHFALNLTLKGVPTAFLCLFWDFEEERLHLYRLDGGALISEERNAVIGSGSPSVLPYLRTLESLDNETPEGLLMYVKSLLKGAGLVDSATNKNIFYGVVEQGEYREGEEEYNA